jgi:hypothetical protein
MAKIAYGLYKGKFLNAVSVGFIPIRWQDFPSSSASASASASGSSSASASTSNPRRKYLEQELLEVSAVGIPANPEALQLGLNAGAIEKADLRDLLDLLRSTTPPLQHSTTPVSDFCSNQAAPNTLAGASGVRSYEAQLLQLARALRDALRR